MYSRPDRPLVVKCTLDKWHKRITFSSTRNCSYELLRHKVEQCFSLSATSYAIAYKDDDGEITNITTDADLTEAIQYFHAGDDAPLSSAASILSGRSFGARKITLRVHITIDYDGPSLSDTSSLASLDEFRNRNGSVQSLSLGAPSVELDDDSITVSSRDNPSALGGKTQSSPASFSIINHEKAASGVRENTSHSSWTSLSNSPRGMGKVTVNGKTESRIAQDRPTENRKDTNIDAFSEDYMSVANRYPEDPSAVFERLKFEEAMGDDASSVDLGPPPVDSRGAAWLRDQNERVIRSMLGALPEPSESDALSLSAQSQDDLGGDLALERDPRGKYYYTYTSAGSSTSHSHDEMYGGASEADVSLQQQVKNSRPNSMHLNWLATQRAELPDDTQDNSLHTHNSDPLPIRDYEYNLGIDKEFLPFLQLPSPPPSILTDCSNCGTLLESIRYVCSTCGEKPPGHAQSEKGKGRDNTSNHNHSYPPEGQQFLSSGYSSSSRTYVGSSDSLFDPQRPKSLPSLPSLPSLFRQDPRKNTNTPTIQQSVGYELCSGCIETAGVNHAVESGLVLPGSSPVVSNDSLSPPNDVSLQMRRSAPKKGQLRHAFQEKVWGHRGWEDVEQDENQVSECSTCSAVTLRKRYKCASCLKLHLCRACYRQVHELHPSHAFLLVPDKPTRSNSESSFPPNSSMEPPEEQTLKHPGVKCAHCLLDIVGARFHCAICDSVDICSNCESAGLPGNLDSSDGGHISSHIMIKIPFPLETDELQNASRRAIHLWTGRDAMSVGFRHSRTKAESEVSSYARTVVGSSSRQTLSRDDHRIKCNSCDTPIHGVRYQCVHCPSSPVAYSLCVKCEEQSYIVHDPMHVFFKLSRPVQRQIAFPYPLLPILYKNPAGPVSNIAHISNPKEYLKSLVHSSAICDRCMTCIEGEWFRCAYCGTDLCDACEEVDTHDDTHVFMVFKALIDMQLFKSFADPETPEGNPPVIPYAVYQ